MARFVARQRWKLASKKANGQLRNSFIVVGNKIGCIARVQAAIMQLDNCGATHVKTVTVHEVVRRQTVWKGEAEVFDHTGHPKASVLMAGPAAMARTTWASGLWQFLKFRPWYRHSRRFVPQSWQIQGRKTKIRTLTLI